VLLLLLSSIFAHANQAPDFKLPGDVQPIALKDYRNKIVYLDFWASWCAPCKQAFPWMSELQQRYRAQGFEVIAINLDSNPQDAREFLALLKPSFSIAYDTDGQIADKYQIKAMPSSFLLNRNGDIAYAHQGFKVRDSAELEARIKALLARP
jgi:thiol-disulfide isomerase/thioredoxin